MTKDYLSTEEFAKWLGMHPNTIRRAVKSGRIEALRVGSGKRIIYRIARTEVQRMAKFNLEEIIEKEVQKRLGER